MLSEYTEGKTEGWRERRHHLSTDRVPILKDIQGRGKVSSSRYKMLLEELQLINNGNK